MYLILISIFLSLFIYFYCIKKFNYWKLRNVPQNSASNTLYVFLKSIVKRRPLAEIMQDLYNQFSGKRYAGVYPLSVPTLLLRDVELIKQITVKDFDHFTDHRSFMPENTEPIWTSNLFSLKGEKWRDMRSTLSPSFTSSKMKAMFILMSDCAETFVNYFQKQGNKTISVDMADALTRYANDVIATSAFGIKVDSLEKRDNEFYTMGKIVSSTFTGTKGILKFMFALIAPNIFKWTGLKLFSAKATDFFLNLVQSTIKIREEQGIIRPDMIHLLMEARKGKDKAEETEIPDAGFATVEEHLKANNDRKKHVLSDIDITAQALIFFFAGFDTVSRSTCFVIHEIGVHTDIQERLREEIDETLASCNGKITYEALTKMKYMDMVVSESLRLWPNVPMVDRVCVKPYTIKPENAGEKEVTLNVGDTVWIPVFPLHRDPEYYPEPDRFDPERFNDENKSKITPYIYLPFGVGPRSCIGSRFALLEIKILLFHILSKFELVPVEKTQIPLKFKKSEMNLTPENGFWLGFKPRTTCL